MVVPRDVPTVAFDAHVVGRRRTGNERYAVELGSALALRPDVRLVAYVDRRVAWPRTPAPPLQELRLRSPFLRIPLELPYRARRDRADLLHVQYVAPPVAGLPVVVTVHDLSFEDVPHLLPAPMRLRLRATVRLAVRRAAAVCTISSFTRDRLVARYRVEPSRVHVTPNGVAAARWATTEEDAERVIRTMGLAEPYVLAVGELSPRKNLPRLVHAVARARRGGAGELSLVVAGPPGRGEEALVAAVDGVAGTRWVRRLGFVQDDVLAALYRRARVVAYLSLYEGFGLPVLEALAAGAVLVASDSTAVPEAAGEAAVLVDATDEAAIAEAIARAATDEGLRAHLAAAGPSRAAAFTWSACAEATARAYQAALGG